MISPFMKTKVARQSFLHQPSHPWADQERLVVLAEANVAGV